MLTPVLSLKALHSSIQTCTSYFTYTGMGSPKGQVGAQNGVSEQIFPYPEDIGHSAPQHLPVIGFSCMPFKRELQH